MDIQLTITDNQAMALAKVLKITSYTDGNDLIIQAAKMALFNEQKTAIIQKISAAQAITKINYDIDINILTNQYTTKQNETNVQIGIMSGGIGEVSNSTDLILVQAAIDKMNSQLTIPVIIGEL